MPENVERNIHYNNSKLTMEIIVSLSLALTELIHCMEAIQ